MMDIEKLIEQLSARGLSNGSSLGYHSGLFDEAATALSALRPVSRERVEKVWPGCEYCTGDVDDRSYLDSKRLYLDKNGILTDEIENIDILRLSFCPVCGKPLTDEAVEMVMERLDALKDE